MILNKVRASHFLNRLWQTVIHFFSDSSPTTTIDPLWIQLTHSSPSGIIIVDAKQNDFPIVYVNEAFQKSTGYAFDEVLGKNCRFMQRGDRDQPALDVIRGALRTKTSCAVTLRNYRKDGTLFWNELKLSPIRNQQGEVTHFFGIQNDVTRIREAEARYNALIEQSNDGVFILNLQGKHLQANQRASEMLGYSVKELVELTYHDLVIPEEHDQSDNVLRRMLDGESIAPYERTFRHKDGHRVFTEINVELVRDEHNKPLYIQSLVRDIGERKRMENNLRATEERFRSFIEQSTDGVVIMDEEGRILTWNPRVVSITGLPAEQTIGKYLWDVQSGLRKESDQREDVYREIKAATESFLKPDNWPQGFRSESTIIVRRDGEERVLQAVIFPIQTTENYHVGSILRDVTEQNRMDEALRASEERLRTIVDNIPIMIGFFNEVGQFEFVNKHWVDRMGWTLDDLAKQDDPLALFYPDKEYRQQVLDFMLSAEPGWRDFETMTQHRGIMQTSWANIPLSSGKTIGFGQDITVRKQAQQREIDLLMEKARLRLLTTFIQNAAHEFRTPLTTISSSAYLLFRLEDAERRKQKYEQIEADVQRIIKLVEMLLFVVKLENADVFQNARVDLGQMLEYIRDEAIRTHGSQPTLHWQPVTDLPLITGDGEYLTYALQQMIENAYRFTPDGGEIGLSAGVEDEQIWIKICDTGSGIPEEAMPHIFETFWRHDTAHTTPGFGLGLSIAHKIITKHGGQIIVESAAGKGTCFRILFPITLAYESG